jgi:Tol biopolymer transport system component
MNRKFALLLLASLLAGCNLTADPMTPTTPPTEISIIITPTHAPTGIPTETPLPAPTESPTIAPTETTIPTETAVPSPTYTPSVTPTASITPQATIPFRFDQWARVELPASITGGATIPLVVFTNSNDQTTISNLATAQPENTVETVFLVNPQFPTSRIELLQLTATTGSQIFPSEAGTAIAYYKSEGALSGLYVLNLDTGLSGRIAPITSMVQRGISSAPAWSPDGKLLAFTLATGYDLDIFLFDRDASTRTTLISSGAYDFYPAWSPDGRYIAFVSDRATCPSWNPADENACDALTTTPPVGGTVHLLEVATGEIRQVSDQFVTEPPRWINNTLLVFAAGDRTDILNPRRTLWQANIPGQSVRQVFLAGEEDGLYLADTWSPDGTQVLFQHVTPTGVEIILMTIDGEVLKTSGDNLVFPRFGMSATWASTGRRIAVGGLGGECPYGVRVTDEVFDLVATGTAPPTMCSPEYSPDGRYVAFSGISAAPDRRNPDGRIDVYVADENGYGLRNLSADLRGSQSFIGWLGGK